MGRWAWGGGLGGRRLGLLGRVVGVGVVVVVVGGIGVGVGVGMGAA